MRQKRYIGGLPGCFFSIIGFFVIWFAIIVITH